MKKLFITAYMLIGMIGFANSEEKIVKNDYSVQEQRDCKVLISLDNTDKNFTNIVILDEDGMRIHVKKIKSDGINLIRYDLSELPKGKYDIEINLIYGDKIITTYNKL